MKKLILILALLMSVPALGANTTTPTALKEYGKSWTMSMDTTGIECVEIHDLSANETFPYVYVLVEESTDGATYDIEANPSDSPSEYSDATLTDLPGASDLTVSYGGWVTIGAPWVCVRLTACSTCELSVTIFSITGGRK